MIFASETEIAVSFRQPSGTTGIVDASFSKKAFCNGIEKSVTILVTEISGGYYYWSFTPDAEGVWLIDVWETGTPANRYGMVLQVDDFETRICGDSFNEQRDSLYNIKSLLKSVYNAGQVVSWRGFRSST